MQKKALVAMSGGVDSSVAALLMISEGFACTGVTLKLYGEPEDDARGTAEKLGIPHHVLDYTDAFGREVILRFIETYERGETPNPCVYCNRYIKFSPSVFAALGGGFDCFATGHYARIQKSGGRFLLKKASDRKKDQSYVLFSLDQGTLARCRFPLGDLSKSEAREIAGERGLSNANTRESQDICFVPDGDYGAFIESRSGRPCGEGDILDIGGKAIGRHKGHFRYTLGQRRGLGVAANEPVYVCAKDALNNTVTLGPESALYSKSFTAGQINLIACDRLEKPVKLTVKTRYLQKERSALAIQTAPDEIRVEFDEAERAVTPGQAAVLYDGDIVVGGGIIRSPIMSNEQ
jgi:tRNA-specific 2-thiouridylase